MSFLLTPHACPAFLEYALQCDAQSYEKSSHVSISKNIESKIIVVKLVRVTDTLINLTKIDVFDDTQHQLKQEQKYSENFRIHLLYNMHLSISFFFIYKVSLKNN